MSKPLDNFEKLFISTHAKLCTIAHTIVRDKAAAEDIVQDVFVKVWSRRDELSIHSSAENYLHKATANASLNYLERRRRLTPFTEQVAETQADSSDKLALKELEKRIFHSIEGLPPKCKTIFVLSRFEGMKYQQIADYLGLSYKTVENQMGTALRRLREDLKPFLTRDFLSTAIAVGISFLLPYLTLLLLLNLFS